MNKLATMLLAAVVAAAIGAGHRAGPAWADEAVTLGAGATTGVYYPLAEAIKMLVNRDASDHGLQITVEGTGGAVANMNALRRGRLNLAFVQSDVQFQALNGLEPFAAAGPFTQLRSLFSTHTEAFTVVARADSGIRSLADLPGKRVNIGNPGSGTRTLMDLLMAAQGWTNATFGGVSELGPDEAAEALCDNRIDATVFVVGHPNSNILQAVASCRSIIVPVTGPAVDRLVASQPYLVAAAVPGGMYASSPNETPTFGVRAALVTTTRLPDEAAYVIVKAVFENLDLLRWMHPALLRLDREAMVRDGLLAPLHEGAARYYREAGLIR